MLHLCLRRVQVGRRRRMSRLYVSPIEIVNAQLAIEAEPIGDLLLKFRFFHRSLINGREQPPRRGFSV